MKIGISYWGFCESFEDCRLSQTPDGHRYGRPLLVDELVRRGHEVYALQQRRESKPYEGLIYDECGYPDLDIVFVEWRWPTYKNSGPDKFETDLDRQSSLLDYYCGKVPVVAWDTDLKMTPEDEARWPEMIVADPTLDPESFRIPRVKMTFWSDFRPLLPASEGSVEFGYVGNNYERKDMFAKYYSLPSQRLRSVGIQTKVWGNWLQRSPEREQPEELISLHPYIAFSDRVGFYDSMHILNNFIATVHITKPRYARQGFVSPRYLENIVVRTPALVPCEFAYSDILGSEWKVGRESSDTADAVHMLKSASASKREQVVLQQQDSLLKVWDFSLDRVVQFLEAVATDPTSAIKNC